MGNKLVLILYSSIFLFFLSSCSDDTPVQPPPPEKIDTVNKYEWTLDTIFGYNCDFIYTADSVNVFISAYPAPLYYNGETYTELNMMDPLFICGYPAGYDKDNVFFGGGKSGTTFGDPILKKWTNGSIASYTLTGDSGVSIRDIFVEGPVDCWLSTRERYKIYHFNAGILTGYSLDSGQRGGVFLRDQSGKLFVSSAKFLGGNKYELRTYMMGNENFHTVSTDTIDDGTEFSGYRARCGNYILGSGKQSVFYFSGVKWEKLCYAPLFPPYNNIGGTSKDIFLSYGKSDAGPWQIYVREGNKWTMEGSNNIYHYLALGANISATQTDVNIIYNSDNGISIHMKGKLKTN